MASSISRPLVTFALFVYNQERFIREAVEAALSQTYTPMEVIISDDASTDNTYEIIKELVDKYDGVHTVRLNKNITNLGIAKHVDKIDRMAIGEWIIHAAGDDISLPDRVAITMEFVSAHPDLAIVEVNYANVRCDKIKIRDNYIPKRKSVSKEMFFELEDFVEGTLPSLTGAARAIRRDLFVCYSPFIDECPTEDTPSLLRLLIRGRGVALVELALLRRIHDKNLSSVPSLAKMNMDALEKQYLLDIEEAVSSGWMTGNKAKKIRDSVVNNIYKRKIDIKIKTKQALTLAEICEALLSNKIKLRYKLYIIKECILYNMHKKYRCDNKW